MSEKPSYLGVLNAIVVAERRGGEILAAWRDATADAELSAVLNVVAIREQEHAAAFTKRMCELGFEVRESPSEEFRQKLELARSNAGDAEKFRRVLGYGEQRDDDDPLARIFDDQTIDPTTGALLGRFIAEERDSERRLQAAWRRIAPESEPRGEEDPALADIADRIDRLARTIEELKELRR
ncbi:MAG: hypothetical protein ACODAC_05330 [Pseudomonadota bacterium]